MVLPPFKGSTNTAHSLSAYFITLIIFIANQSYNNFAKINRFYYNAQMAVLGGFANLAKQGTCGTLRGTHALCWGTPPIPRRKKIRLPPNFFLRPKPTLTCCLLYETKIIFKDLKIFHNQKNYLSNICYNSKIIFWIFQKTKFQLNHIHNFFMNIFHTPIKNVGKI